MELSSWNPFVSVVLRMEEMMTFLVGALRSDALVKGAILLLGTEEYVIDLDH
jgi:hypothetical protein